MNIFKINMRYIEKISYSGTCMKLTNPDNFLTREVTGERNSFYEYISLKKFLKDYSTVIMKKIKN